MKTIISAGLLIAYFCISAQILPECIEKKIALNPDKYEGILKLPNNETVYRFAVRSRPNCMDCSNGTMYLDSLCDRVASFTMGIRKDKFVKEGYKESWFLVKQKIKDKEVTDSAEKQIDYEKSKAYFGQFQKPVKYEVKSVKNDENPLNLLKNDIIEVSLENGMILYRNNKKYSQYKLIPATKEFSYPRNCIKAPCPTVKETKNYFRWEDYGIIFNDNSVLVTKFNDNTKPRINSNHWEILYEIKKM